MWRTCARQLPIRSCLFIKDFVRSISPEILAFRTVTVVCARCQITLFKYKKANGKKSNLVKLYIERVVQDPFNLLVPTVEPPQTQLCDLSAKYRCTCPSCGTTFGRPARISGQDAVKIIGGRLAMK
jgi:hypothetical protein